MKILLSPCLYCANEDTFDLTLLDEILNFIVNNLNGVLDEYTNSFYSEKRLYAPPVIEFNKFNTYVNVINNLRRLKINGNIVNVQNSNLIYNIKNMPEFKIINNDEFQYMVDYIYEVKEQDFLLFLGDRNYGIKESLIQIIINAEELSLPIIKNPWLEKSCNFNKYINKSSFDSIFINGDLCERLDKEMKQIAKGNSDNRTLYKKYGEYVALRNDFVKYNISDPYINTDYYIRKDKKYIISVDLLHGHFEVYQGTGKQLWIHQYNFSGKEIPLGEGISIDEMRNSHRVHKRHQLRCLFIINNYYFTKSFHNDCIYVFSLFCYLPNQIDQ